MKSFREVKNIVAEKKKVIKFNYPTGGKYCLLNESSGYPSADFLNAPGMVVPRDNMSSAAPGTSGSQ